MPIIEPRQDGSLLNAPAAGKVLLYFHTDGRPHIIDSNAVNIPLISPGATQMLPKWKNGVVGNPYIAGDTVVLSDGDRAMVQLADSEQVTLQLPTADTIKQVGWIPINTTPGVFTAPHIDVVPAGTDRIDAFAAGQSARVSDTSFYYDLQSDGNGRWNAVAFTEAFSGGATGL